MKKAQGNVAAMVIMITLLAGIIIYVLVVPNAERERLIGEYEQPYEYSSTVLDVSPGEIDPLHYDAGRKTIELSDVLLDNTPVSEEQLLSPQVVVKSSIISEDQASFNFDLQDKSQLSSIGLTFNVFAKTEGELNVKVNGNRILSSTLLLGQNTLEIPLNMLKIGTNQVSISVSAPGIKFWQTRSYTLTDLNVVKWQYTSSTATASQSFDLENYDLTNAELSFFAKKVSDSAAPVTLWLNGNEIFKAVPIAGQTVDISEDLLIEDGTNKFDWKVDAGAKYEVKFIQLLLEGADIKGGIGKYDFTISSTQWNYIDNYNYNCTLDVLKLGTETEALAVKINDRSQIIELGEEYKGDICEFLEKGENTIEISPYNTMTIKRLRVIIEGEREQ